MTQAIVTDAARPVVSARREPVTRMSERYWGLTWPTTGHGGLTVVPVPFEACLPFMTAHYAHLFESEPDRFFEEKMTDAKRRYLAEADCFLFQRDGKDVGLCVCDPSDWSSYYIRTYSLLPEVRHGEFSMSFLRYMFERLRAVGVKRVEADTAPSSLAVQRALTGLGMLITHTVASERWGLLLHLTGFLDEDAERAFRRQFLQGSSVPQGCPRMNKPGKE